MRNLRGIIKAFWLGVVEGWQGLAIGITYDGDPESPRSRAYDHGRNTGEALRAGLSVRHAVRRLIGLLVLVLIAAASVQAQDSRSRDVRAESRLTPRDIEADVLDTLAPCTLTDIPLQPFYRPVFTLPDYTGVMYRTILQPNAGGSGQHWQWQLWLPAPDRRGEWCEPADFLPQDHNAWGAGYVYAGVLYGFN